MATGLFFQIRKALNIRLQPLNLLVKTPQLALEIIRIRIDGIAVGNALFNLFFFSNQILQLRQLGLCLFNGCDFRFFFIAGPLKDDQQLRIRETARCGRKAFDFGICLGNLFFQIYPPLSAR